MLKMNNRNGKKVILRKCSKCLLVFYCSKECQRYHWSAGDHKRFCLSPKDRNLLAANQSFEDETSALLKEDCVICREGITRGTSFTLPCSREFHFDCLYIAGKLTSAKRCPICRTPLPSYLSLLSEKVGIFGFHYTKVSSIEQG